MAKRKSQTQPEAPTDPMDLAIRVSDCVQIKTIDLVTCSAWKASKVGSHKDEFAIDLGIKLSYTKEDEGQKLNVFVEFHLQGKDHADSADSPCLRVAATYMIAYSLSQPEGLGDANFKAFAEINGVFHGWPFWREFVSNTTARMGICPVTLPVHRVQSYRKVNQSPQKTLPFDE